MNKNELMAGLNRAYLVAQKRDKIYEEYESKMFPVKQEQSILEDVPMWFRGVISALPVGLLLILVLVQQKNYSFVDAYIGIIGPIVLMLILATIAVNASAYAMWINSKWYKEKKVELAQQEDSINEEYAPIVIASMEESKAAFPELGTDYHTTHALGMMMKYLENGRASTLKEMLDTYEADCHRMRMEESQKQYLAEIEEMQDTIEYLQDQLNYARYNK